MTDSSSQRAHFWRRALLLLAFGASSAALVTSCGVAALEPIPSPPVDPDPCRPGAGATGSPTTIAQAIDLINSLPRPVTLACFVRALDRPLRLNATDSVFSAQPAEGRDRPRIFIESGALIMSVSLGEQGLPLLEFGEGDARGDSIKGELRFPVEDAALPQSAPFAHIAFDETLSTCGLCHPQERVVEVMDGHPVYTSRALRPQTHTYVSLEVLSEQQAQVCADEPDSARCALLEALLAREAPLEFTFPMSLSVFF